MNETGTSTIVGLALLLIVFAALWPLGVVWALNTLFSTAIPMGFKSWLAVLVLFTALKLCVSDFSKKP